MLLNELVIFLFLFLYAENVSFINTPKRDNFLLFLLFQFMKYVYLICIDIYIYILHSNINKKKSVIYLIHLFIYSLFLIDTYLNAKKLKEKDNNNNKSSTNSKKNIKKRVKNWYTLRENYFSCLAFSSFRFLPKK